MKGFPYSALEGTPLWAVVEQAVDDLVKNQDLDERTTRRHIVGYLVQAIRRYLDTHGQESTDSHSE